MHFTKILLNCFLFAILALPFQTVLGQTPAPTQQDEQMKQLMKQYFDFTNTNKNSQALEVLQRFAILQEAKLNRQKDSSINTIQNDFFNSRKSRLAEITDKENDIAALKSENDDLDNENLKMTRDSLLFFGILIGLAVLILLNRFRALATVKERLELTNNYLKHVNVIHESASKDKNDSQILTATILNAKRQMDDASGWIQSVASDKQNPLNKQAVQLIQNTQKAEVLLIADTEIEPGIKLNTDLNQLIDEVTDQAYQYIGSEIPEFNCVIVRDLEKILPKIDIIPADIRLVVFNLLINAFESVHDKKNHAPKGYQPKITITTRKLPRFVQIRIKDNGIGISEKDQKQLLNPFYTNRKSARNMGLGLSESARIINVAHKGELLIESDLGNGTDFIIRFTTLTLS